MDNPNRHWSVVPPIQPPDWLVQLIHDKQPGVQGQVAAQLLWQRGLRDRRQVMGFLDPNDYQPTSPFAFGEEMHWAVERLQQARDRHAKVTIWGDFDADGLTATALLWEGLGQFFDPHRTLSYTVPNRLTDSYGLSIAGLDRLAQQGCELIVTCDTGSTNLRELAYAKELGIDVIVTDHHTLPDQRPPVTAIINPRMFASDHPLAHLSGVAVAYKLVEALYLELPHVPQRPLAHLLDLVAIGLIADLVNLTGDCRYLAQRGIERLQQQQHLRTRPGIARLLELCKRSGDRPTDISFGLGPRINAVSRIHGDAHFCIELLTSQDPDRCEALAAETELANSRRKSVQKDVAKQAIAKLDPLDLSTTQVIVLSEPQWPIGVLGLVAGQIAQEYDRPTILLSEITGGDQSEDEPPLARGSARSVHQLDLYQLVKDQAYLLTSFGGHPLAAGMSLPIANISLFTAAINQQARRLLSTQSLPPLQADLAVTVAALAKDQGKALFRELKLLEPCGMGNPVPKLLIQNCWFEDLWHQNMRDRKGKLIQYIKTRFQLRDVSTDTGFPGVWWGHYKTDIPPGPCDALVELDFNSYRGGRQTPHYEVRLIAVRSATPPPSPQATTEPVDWILDWRQHPPVELQEPDDLVVLHQCPTSWDQLGSWLYQAHESGKKIAIAFHLPEQEPAITQWHQLVGIAKYLARTGTVISTTQLEQKLNLTPPSLAIGLQALASVGFQVTQTAQALQVQQVPPPSAYPQSRAQAIHRFLVAVEEEQFRQRYFQAVPLETLKAIAQQVSTDNKK